MNVRELYKLSNEEKLDYIERLLTGSEFRLSHPVLDCDTYSSESQRFSMLNIIRFADKSGSNEWFLIQLTDFTEGYILNGEYYSLSELAAAETLSSKVIKEKRLEEFSKKPGSGFISGIILSQYNPFHFIYDQLVTCFQIKKTMPNIFDSVYTDETCFFSSVTNGLALEDGATYILPCYKPHNYYSKAAEDMHEYFMTNTGEVSYSSDLTLWFGIQGQKRSWLQQVEGCVKIIESLFASYNTITLLIDGWTSFSNNPVINEDDQKIYQEITRRLDNRVNIINLIGSDYISKLEHVKKIDYFIANSGSGAIIPMMFANKKGVLHSNGDLHTFKKAYTKNVRSDNIKVTPKDKVHSEAGDIAMYNSYSIHWTVIYNLLLELGCKGELVDEKTIKHVDSKFEFGNLEFTDKTTPADALREIALLFDKVGDRNTAYNVMCKALEQRPSGPFIKQKVEEWKSNL